MFVKIYSFVNKILEKIWFKLDYIGKIRYKRIIDNKIDTIIDVGANKWQTIEKWKHLLWNKFKKIYSFEPLPFLYDWLVKKYKLDDRIRIYDYWLWSTVSNTTMNQCSMDDSSSLLYPTKKNDEIYHLNYEKKVDIKIETLDNILSDIEWNILLKIDVQWYELECLKGWVNLLKKVSYVIIETSFVELYQWWPLFDDIYSFMIKHWFIYKGSIAQAWNPSNWEPLQQDAIFVKKNL